ncbi:phage integrase N-terminal SAM-like domain-containing protein [Burkholderia sp. Bp9143]|uniref:phage integrase N-terminal SAM-like domain-containing protein n=1 Tax=Burkholderia sp. Bp9143 TaxID=2184574 RepID=UPI0021AB46A5|nr:phage integrase N-terminal SAM-like domain-containing protein [Burkholderia sp. Bp9143]
MIDDMCMCQLSPTTQNTYLRIVREFCRFLGRSPDSTTVDDVRHYQLHLVNRGTSPVSLINAINNLTFYFKVTLNRSKLINGCGRCARPARHRSRSVPMTCDGWRSAPKIKICTTVIRSVVLRLLHITQKII